MLVTFKDGLPSSATEFQEIVDFTELMNSDSDADIDNEIPIKTVIFSNALPCLETENIRQATGCAFTPRLSASSIKRLANQRLHFARDEVSDWLDQAFPTSGPFGDDFLRPN
ncbi:hypothetical protein TNCV_2813561 [Trichonephila clavipes]|nr:hypothetical protein TNCV_2813561 [Trichonephila clavipes]